MVKMQFKRGRAVQPEPAEIWQDGPQDGAQGYDLGIVSVLPICKDGQILEWATLEEIAHDIRNYNSQFPGEGFNPDPAHIAYSLMKAVEIGLVHSRLYDDQPAILHEVTQEYSGDANGSRHVSWFLDGRKVLTLYQLRLATGFSRCNVIFSPISGFDETLLYMNQIAAAARCIAQEWNQERDQEKSK